MMYMLVMLNVCSSDFLAHSNVLDTIGVEDGNGRLHVGFEVVVVKTSADGRRVVLMNTYNGE